MRNIRMASAREYLLWLGAVFFISSVGVALTAGVSLSQDTISGRWDDESAADLLTYADRIGSHGLDPDDYGTVELQQAIQGSDASELERAASRTFGLIARDLSEGHIRPGFRGRYYISQSTLTPAQAVDLIEVALRNGDIANILEQLAPQGAQYAGLRRALAQLPIRGEVDKREALLVNLERWRWLPREFGSRTVLVNIPEYRLTLIESEQEVASHRVIVGAPDTPTPQFSATISAVTFNPSWHVPQSIVDESIGRLVRNQPELARARGYVWNWGAGNLRVIQQPGPTNALGQIRFEMPNAHSIFIHDTPSKDLFAREVRTFSHGCIRTENPIDLAEKLLAGSDWNRERIDGTIGSRRTLRVELDHSVPVFIVYLSAVVGADGTVSYLGDPYGLDSALAEGLGNTGGTPLALNSGIGNTQSGCASSQT